MKHKGQHFGKAPSIHFLTLQLDSAWVKRTTSSQPLLAVHGYSLILRPLPPPKWPGNEASMTLLVESFAII